MSRQTIGLAAAAAIAAAPSGATFPAGPAAPVPYDLVSVELDRPRRLLLSWGAMRRIRDLTGFDFRQPSEGAPWDSEMVPVVLAEALRHEDPEITAEHVEEKLIHIGNLGYVIDRIFACMGIDAGGPVDPKGNTDGPAEKEEAAEGEVPLSLEAPAEA